jgi:alkanesulfonate monooxygenase SsuD/methylene tetrahydromethanopterin reductase-like flavin-dependent oxidoreductase (luciferase family)
MKVYGFDLLPWPYLDEPSYYPDPNSLFDPVKAQQVYAEHLEQMALYEEYGFDAICMNEHHSKPYGLMPSPNLVVAALIQRTSRIRIGILGNLAALHGHPVRLAEEIAMLDCMSGGRIISGFVRGVPQEYLALSGSIAESRQRMEEAIELIIKAWSVHEPFEWHGKYFDYDRVSIWPRPFQQPHPPVIIPCESDETVQLAARLRVPTASAYRPTARARSIFESYKRVAAEAGWTPPPETFHLMRHVYVGESMAQAREEAEPHLMYQYRKLQSYGRGAQVILGETYPARPPGTYAAGEKPMQELSFDEAQERGYAFIGEPDYVLEKIKAQLREVGAGVFMGLFQFGSLPHALAKKNIASFAKTVLPELHRL